MTRPFATALATLVALTPGLLPAAVTGQWDFNSGNLAASVGAALQFRADTAASTLFGTTTSFGIPGIGGQAAQVMKFPACSPTQGFIMPHGVGANGGGARVNRYSVVMDVLFPATSAGFRSLWQTETNAPTGTDGEVFVSAANGIGISSEYHGTLSPDTWHRVVLTVDCTQRELGKYIDGTNVLSGPVGAAPLGTNAVQYLDPATGGSDQRWSLESLALLFADEDNETGVGYVNSIQVHDRVLTAQQVAALGGPTAAGIPATIPATLAQWDFNGSLASSSGGTTLVPGAALPATAAGVTFSNVMIDSQPAQAAAFTRGSYLRLAHGFAANGGGTNVNDYTLIMDVMFPSRPSGWAALWQTSVGNNNDGEWFTNPGRGLGISGNYGGDVADGTWNRIALVVDVAQGTFTSYLNGAQVQQNAGLSLDGRFSLGPQALLFADEDQENAAGFVNSVQLRNRALTSSEIAELGGPSAAGISTPATPTLNVVSPNGGELYQAGSTQLVSWAAANPSGGVQIDVYRDSQFYRALGTVPMRNSNFVWVIDPRLGDTNTYRIQLTSISFPNVSDASDAPFSVFGSAPPPASIFGQPLQANGGFEALFANWQTILGGPLTLTTAGGKGAPRSGVRFFHGGLNPGGDAIVRQEIDLLAAGFTAFDIDGGAALDAEAWLRNWFGAGTFDDQVYYRVACLDADGGELSSVRCMIAANNAWLQRTLSGLVPPGTRRLRLEVVGRHRRDLDNDSMADDLVVRLQEVQRPVTPRITKLPMLQDVRTNAMTMLWETDGNLALHSVDWGRSNVTENSFSHIETLKIDNTHYVHRAMLANLETETSYVYRVRSGTNQTATFSFRTAPKRETPITVAWWGDSHQGTTTLRNHIANMLAHAPDMICVAGDMVNSGNAINEWHDYWFKPLEHLNCAQTRPVIYARGNHDGEHALAYAYSKLPGNEAWFAFDYGNCRFIFLDTETSTGSSPEQFAWLQNELARPETQKAAFRIVCFHRPPYVNLWNGGGHTGEGWVRNDWVPLFTQRNVDIVISGHAHNYNRGSTNGVTYIVSGGGGGTIDVERVAFWPLYTVEYSRYHFDLMEVDGNTLTWQTFDDSNRLIDLFTLTSRVPELKWTDPNPAGGTVAFTVSGKPGSRYHVQGSSNQVDWTTFATNTFTANSPALITNVVPADSPQRFFRAQITP